ncbi:4-pyridoxate dehydrogenase-like [Haemaphysalis longicornis]
MDKLKAKFFICVFSLSVLHESLALEGEEVVQAEKREQPEVECYDYIVVGSGSAGSVVANRLALRGNYTVLVIESGVEPAPDLYVPFNAPFSANESNSWQYYTVEQKNACLSFDGKKAPMTQGKVLGGTSSINSMNMVRGNPSDYDTWENVYNASGWNYSSVLQYFKDTENFNITDFPNETVTKYHGKQGETPVNYPNYHTNLSNVFLEACKQSGYEYVDYNGEKKTGYSRTQCNTQDGMRMSAYTCFLMFQSNMTNRLNITTNSTATKIYFNERRRATTVEYKKNGKLINVTAGREVIVSAGAIGSPKLLMLSGIGPRNDLERLQIPLMADLPVGDGLQDHVIFLGLVVKTASDLIGFSDLLTNKSKMQYKENHTGLLSLPGAYEAFLFTSSSNETRPPVTADIALALTALYPSDKIAQSPYVSNLTYEKYYKPLINKSIGFMTTITMVQPQSRGTVKLNSTNVDDAPLIDPQLLSVQEDIDRTVRGILKVKKLFETTKAMEDIGANVWNGTFPYCENMTIWSEEYLQCFLKYGGFPGMHVCCTCAMGNHNRSVVDERLRVKGNISGLRVVDASVMPVITSGNTHAPVMMIAAKAADMIIQDAKAEDEGIKYR